MLKLHIGIVKTPCAIRWGYAGEWVISRPVRRLYGVSLGGVYVGIIRMGPAEAERNSSHIYSDEPAAKP